MHIGSFGLVQSQTYILVDFFIINLLLRKEINDNIFVYKKNHNQDSKLRKVFEILHYVASQKPARDKNSIRVKGTSELWQFEFDKVFP